MAKPTLGIIGGGQLGSLLAEAAKKIEVNTVVFSDDPNSPAKNFTDKFIYSKYNDLENINRFEKVVDIITFEFENIPFETLNTINQKKPVLPNPKINKIIQNRYSEKNFLKKLNIKTTNYELIKSEKDIEFNKKLLPGLLKTCTLGYDGKGQYKINKIDNLSNLNIKFNVEFILEKLINIKKEISVIVTRFGKNKYEIYEPIENLHEHQILKKSKIPADISKEHIEKSKKWTIKIAENLDYIGTMCVEFFIDKKDELYVNEIAPRVHNSGHLTINSHNISQFENHVRAVCKLEQKKTKKLYNAEMINLLGNEINNYRGKILKKNQFFYDYLKKEIKEKRKMGHVTIIE